MTASVYFIQAGGAGGPIKIGWAADLDRRLDGFETANPEPLRVLHVVTCGDKESARALERELHATFRDLRIQKRTGRRSEWFRFDERIVAEIARLRASPPPADPGRPGARVVQGRAVVHGWHRPRCSTCGEPIATLGEAYAFWWVVDGAPADRSHVAPGINHRGRCAPADDRDGLFLNDLPVEWLRRAPLEAIHVASRWHGDDADRLAWVAWLAVVLGLPANAWNCVSALWAHGEVADVLIDRVPTADEIRRRSRG